MNSCIGGVRCRVAAVFECSVGRTSYSACLLVMCMKFIDRRKTTFKFFYTLKWKWIGGWVPTGLTNRPVKNSAEVFSRLAPRGFVISRFANKQKADDIERCIVVDWSCWGLIFSVFVFCEYTESFLAALLAEFKLLPTLCVFFPRLSDLVISGIGSHSVLRGSLDQFPRHAWIHFCNGYFQVCFFLN